jgi:Zn-dependent peptidase ImmA (M78 family)
VVLLGHKHDEPGRVAFFVAHEVGHITNGDCSPDSPIIDGEGEEEVPDDTAMERAADQYATSVLVGNTVLPDVETNNFRDLAKMSSEIERS